MGMWAWLDLVILEVSSNHNNSMVLWYTNLLHFPGLLFLSFSLEISVSMLRQSYRIADAIFTTCNFENPAKCAGGR